MAHSPESAAATVGDDYTQSWDALGALIAAGKSFSGRERNAAFLNLGARQPAFATASAAVNLDQIDDSRAVIPVDWDRDGDLDLWYSNRTAPRLRFLRNDLAAGGRWLALRLEGRAANRDAIGARAELTLRTADGTTRTLWRRVKAGDGFLSQAPKTLHFGFREDESIERLVIRWPAPGLAEQIVSGLEPNAHFTVVEGAAAVRTTRPPLAIAPGAPVIPESPAAVRAPLVNRLPTGPITYLDREGQTKSLAGPQPAPVLLLFWGSWCPQCAAEMKEMAARAAELKSLRVLALAVDTAKTDPDRSAVDDVRNALASRPWPFESGFASQATVSALARLEARALYPERPLALPSAYLLAPDGRLAVIYHGPVGVDTLIKDAAFAVSPPAELEAAVFPFPGRSARPLFPLHAGGLAQAFREAGYLDDARATLRRAIDGAKPDDARTRTSLLLQLADLEDAASRPAEAAAAWKESIKLSPNDPALHLALAASLWKARQPEDARATIAQANQLAQDPAAFQNQLGKVWQALGEHAQARDAFAASLAAAPGQAETTFNLAVARQFTGQIAEAIADYQTALTLNPDLLDAASNLAWLLATTKDASLRNPARALELAQQVNQSTRGQSAAVLDNLAAAQAATGDLAAAAATATRALALARATGDTSLATEIARHLAAYQSGKPWQE